MEVSFKYVEAVFSLLPLLVGTLLGFVALVEVPFYDCKFLFRRGNEKLDGVSL